jgi:surface antigen
MVLAGLVSVPAQAQPPELGRSSTTLCVGYAGCASAGMTSAGYAAVNRTMYWRMYSGHNCTNYAAYRMVHSGLPNSRPWTGSGNATNWGFAMDNLRNGRPAVGAVAWWKAYAPPAGGAGHVAYVERVVSDDEIIVSQDSWGGDFSWARITRDSGRWPTGFLHFNDVTLRNTAAPTVTGTAKVGSLLTASGGTWEPSGATLGYQWQADGVDLAGATSPTLRLLKGHQGRRLSVVVTATKPGYPTVSAASPRSAAVAPGRLTNTVAPAIVGDPMVDTTLTADPGTWNPVPRRLIYAWYADGQPIAAATTRSFTPGPDLLAHRLSVTVTARKPGYAEVPVAAPASAPVAPGTFTVTTPPAVTGTPMPGETLTLDPGSSAPEAAEVGIEWLRDGTPVADVAGTTYALTNADLGARITARVTDARPGYTPQVTSAAATQRVRTVPHLHLRVLRGTHRLRLVVGVTAHGVRPVTGVVTVRHAGALVAQQALRDGSATTVLPALRAGSRDFVVRYRGSTSVGRTWLRQSVLYS